MYYISLGENNNLAYYCRNCGQTDEIVNSENLCVSKTYLKSGEKSFSHVVNRYTKLDPTLPRISTIKCPNVDCVSNKHHQHQHKAAANEREREREREKETGHEHDRIKNEIIYIRYDDVNMNYVYLCSNCDTIWKTEQTSS